MRLRTDTIETQREDRAVDHDRQQVCFALAIKGEGKSQLIEALAEEEFFLGYTVIDLHAPLSGNMENAFWCIPRLNGDDELREFKQNPKKFTRRRTCISMTLLCSESLIIPQADVDRFNDRAETFEEWVGSGKEISQYPHVNPPIKPEKEWGKELIRFVKLPPVTSKGESDNDQKAWKLIEQALLDARSQRRIVVMNRKLMSTENQYFWTMELFIRNLQLFYDLYCIKKYPKDVGVETYDQMKLVDKNWHRMCIVTREMGELAPAKLKGDKSGQSLSVKKALLQLARTVRHGLIDWFGDWQKNNDVDDSIRNQCDTWFYKKYNIGLAGEEKKHFFDRIIAERDRIFLKIRNRKKAMLVANSLFPDVGRLAKRYFFCHFLSDTVRLFKVPEMKHQHKEPEMKFHEMTGIWLVHDPKKVPTEKGAVSTKVGKNDQSALFNLIWVMRNPSNGKPKSWDEILAKVIQMQEDGELSYPSRFSEKDRDWLGATYGKMKKKFEPPVQIK